MKKETLAVLAVVSCAFITGCAEREVVVAQPGPAVCFASDGMT